MDVAPVAVHFLLSAFATSRGSARGSFFGNWRSCAGDGLLRYRHGCRRTT
jgi:hypothetical protein